MATLQEKIDKAKAAGYSDEEINSYVQANRGILEKAYDVLSVPQKVAESGLKSMASALEPGKITPLPGNANMMLVPPLTGNLPLDIAKGTPHVLAETVAETAPTFISPEAMLMGGAGRVLKAAKPAATSIGRNIARQLESASGIAPEAEGALTETFKHPSTLFAKGMESAKKVYATAKDKAGLKHFLKTKGATRPLSEVSEGAKASVKEIENAKIIDKALQRLNKGILSPSDAQEARKAVDSLYGKKSFSQSGLQNLRDKFNDIAKSSPELKEADRVWQKAVYADAIRHILPQNKYGGASAFKTMMMVLNPKMAWMSPGVQGIGAALSGTSAKAVSPLLNSSLMTTAGAAWDAFKNLPDTNMKRAFMNAIEKKKK